MPTSFRYGYEGTLWYSATPISAYSGAGSALAGGVTWVALTNVMDVDGNYDSDSVDTTTRAEAANGWTSEVNVLKKGEFTFTMRWKPNDSAFNALRDAWLGGDEIALLDLDGPKGSAQDEGNQGLSGNFTLSFGQKKPVKGIMTVEVKAKLSSFPLWVECNNAGALIAS